jgi:hypothetical protein
MCTQLACLIPFACCCGYRPRGGHAHDAYISALLNPYWPQHAGSTSDALMYMMWAELQVELLGKPGRR